MARYVIIHQSPVSPHVNYRHLWFNFFTLFCYRFFYIILFDVDLQLNVKNHSSFTSRVEQFASGSSSRGQFTLF